MTASFSLSCDGSSNANAIEALSNCFNDPRQQWLSKEAIELAVLRP
ncbi:hypothetical protein TIFTF001_016957 [Ficus carica]|uniref:Uncharacterized protein n=1 Tax=Ficus carica TaxID=3494 RepID=A0AA88A778_FICCA|nr:hypothetical protein TIFTF001_016957 [Ficus carica]